jgi:hypothetical protein
MKIDFKKLNQEVRNFTKRETIETKVAAKIFMKIISKKKVTDEEITFLKEHSMDLMKLIPVIVMLPTPIPYLEISLILKGFGIDLLPKSRELNIPKTI